MKRCPIHARHHYACHACCSARAENDVEAAIKRLADNRKGTEAWKAADVLYEQALAEYARVHADTKPK